MSQSVVAERKGSRGDSGQSWGLKMVMANSMAREGSVQTRVTQEADVGPHGQ